MMLRGMERFLCIPPSHPSPRQDVAPRLQLCSSAALIPFQSHSPDNTGLSPTPAPDKRAQQVVLGQKGHPEPPLLKDPSPILPVSPSVPITPHGGLSHPCAEHIRAQLQPSPGCAGS